MTPARAWTYSKRSGLLLLVALPLSLFAVKNLQPGDLRISRALSDLDRLRQVIAVYRERQGNLPVDPRALVRQDLLERWPQDPWGHEYVYRPANNAPVYELYSRGLNGIDEGGAGDDVTDVSKDYACKTYGLNCPFPGAQWVVLGITVAATLGLLGFAAFGGAAICGLAIDKFRRRSREGR